MLFKRKGGNKTTQGRDTERSEDASVRREERGSMPPGGHSLGRGWDAEARQEMDAFFEQIVPDDTHDDTRRPITEQGESSKEAPIDWDVAAREEITALFGAKEDVLSSNGKDDDLEAVRRAIAERKHKSMQPPGVHAGGSPQLSSHASKVNKPEPQDDSGPRLDWLVDFISDDDRKDVQAASSNARNGRTPVVPTETNVGLDNIEVVPRTQPKSNDDLGASAIRGDGYGNPQRPGAIPSSNNRGEVDKTALYDDVKKKNIGGDPMVRPASRSGPDRIEPQSHPASESPGSPETSGRNLPQPRRSMDLEALRTKDRVVAILLKKQLVTMNQVYEAQKIKEREGLRETLWRILVEMASVNRDAVFEEAARIYAFPIANTEGKLDAKFVRSVMETLSPENRDQLLNLHLVPFECETEQQSGNVKLVFITHDPMRTEVRMVMKELKLDRFDLYYAPKAAVDTLIAEAFPRKNEFLERINDDPMAYDLGMSYEEDLIDEDALEAEISRSTLINLFEATLVEAVRHGASDIHIYPNAKKRVEIHFRVDGRLTLWHTEHKVHPEALLAVIKDNAMNVDRFERDAAQDGYIQRWIDDVLIRFRVSVLPIANASHEIRSESIVIRVLDDRKVIRDLRQLGLLEEAMHRFEQAIKQPHGMVILTGPTGSGKSTSLVAALHHVISGEVNVLTVEDPVEYIIPGVRQIKLNYKLELENALRAILRHDPDIVMVGEMRDRKTAELAIKLANTGHLTFSTLHTNDAPSAISRLYKMGIEPFLIAYAINLIVAQRLIRELCPTCKQQDPDPDPVMLEQLGFTQEEIDNIPIYTTGNDEHCPTCKGIGYKGRRAICEALYFSREIRHMIVEADKLIDEGRIKEQAVKEGMLSLRDSAREIVKMGQTSVREMIRVVTSDV